MSAPLLRGIQAFHAAYLNFEHAQNPVGNGRIFFRRSTSVALVLRRISQRDDTKKAPETGGLFHQSPIGEMFSWCRL